MEIKININNCAECPNYKFYKKCKVLNIKVNKNGINEKCPFNKTFKTENKTSENKIKENCIYTNAGRIENKYYNRIKELLKSKNITITELATQFNISKVAMYILISTVSKKHSEKRQQIADFFNVPYNSIFEAKKETLDANKKNQ